MSELLPHTARHADELCILRAVQADSPNHPVATRQLHTGNLFDTVPSMGSWLSYGLGSENQQLPSYITILPGEGERNYSSAFLPAIHQGTAIQHVGSSPDNAPIRNLSDSSMPREVQRRRIDLIQTLNHRQLARLEMDQKMEGVIEWMAGGGVKSGITHGATDDFGYYGIEGQVHINDLHATMLHLMGLDHERLTFEHHGRPFRLTDVAGKVVSEILA